MNALITSLVCAGVILASPGMARADEVVLATESHASTVTPYGGVAAWSSYVQGRGYVLRLYRGGRISTPPLRPGDVPFDVDLGPDADGRATAVYSRCDRQRAGRLIPVNCRLYRYTPGGQERRIRGVSRRGYSEHAPTIWRSRVAFARYRARGETTVVDRLHLLDGAHVRALPRGTVRRGSDPPEADAGVQGMDLRGQRLAYDWTFLADHCRTPSDVSDPDVEAFPTASEVWLVDTRIRSGRRLAQGCANDKNDVGAASLYGSGLSYLQHSPDGTVINRRIGLPGGTRTRSAIDPTTLTLVRDHTTVISERQIPSGIPGGAPTVFQIVLIATPLARSPGRVSTMRPGSRPPLPQRHDPEHHARHAEADDRGPVLA